MRDSKSEQKSAGTPTLVALRKFCCDADITACTAWRWRKRGWLETVNICGKLYISAEAIARFKARAAAGEFSQEPVVPKRVKFSEGA